MNDHEKPKQRPGFFHSVLAVLWGMLGLRRHKAYRDQDEQLNPFHVLVAALIALVVFIAVLVFFVRLAVG